MGLVSRLSCKVPFEVPQSGGEKHFYIEKGEHYFLYWRGQNKSTATRVLSLHNTEERTCMEFTTVFNNHRREIHYE